MIPLVIILFIDVQDGATALPGAVVRAAEHALGTNTTISVRELDADVVDAELAPRGREAGASLVARISWTGDVRREARLVVFDLASGRTHLRKVAFEPQDSPVERGRTLGLLLAATIDPEGGGRVDRASPPTASPTAPAPPASVAAPVTPAPAAARWGVDAAADVGYAPGGAGSGYGGGAGVRRIVGERLAVRLGGRARFGNVAVAQASSFALALSAGAVFGLLATDDQRLGLSLRGEALLLWESLTHLSSDDPAPVRYGRALPGAAAALEGWWSLAPSVQLVLVAGPEIAFGRTAIFVGPNRVAELTPLRVFGQLGLLARF